MKILLTSLCIALATSTVSAAEPAKTDAVVAAPTSARIELARQFTSLINPADKMTESLREVMLLGASADLDKIEDEAERTAAEGKLDELLTRLEPRLRELMPAMLEAYAQVYSREFSDDELEQLIAFAKTPTGYHYLSRADFLDLDPAILGAQEELRTGIAPIVEDFQKQACAEKAAKRLAAGEDDAKCSMG